MSNEPQEKENHNDAPAEAGFSMNFQMEHPIVGNVQVTFRGARASDALYVVDQVREFYGEASQKGWKFKTLQTAPPPQNKAAEIVEAAGNTPSAQAIREESAKIPDAPNGKQWLTLDAVKVVIKPQPNDVYTIEFYQAGHQWPDITANKWKLAQAAGLLKHVTSADVTKAAELSLNCRVYYVQGKEKANKPGDFWKDIHHVRLIGN